MGKKLSLKDKIVKMYKKNETAGMIYITFIKNRSEKDKREAIEIFIELAKVDIEDTILRAKALAILGFFKDMCCGYKVEEYYKDGSIICDYQNIPKVIEDNCKEIIKTLESSEKIELQENTEFYEITSDVIHCLHSYQVDPNIVLKLFDLLEEKLNLEEKRKFEMNLKDHHINDQILRLRPKFKMPGQFVKP